MLIKGAYTMGKSLKYLYARVYQTYGNLSKFIPKKQPDWKIVKWKIWNSMSSTAFIRLAVILQDDFLLHITLLSLINKRRIKIAKHLWHFPIEMENKKDKLNQIRFYVKNIFDWYRFTERSFHSSFNRDFKSQLTYLNNN